MKISKKTISSLTLLVFFMAINVFVIEKMLPKPYHEDSLDAILTLESKGKVLESKEALQLRKNGKKELYVASEGQNSRNKTALSYAESVLTLDKAISKNYLNERMKDVHLIREEEGLYTMMNAENASIIFDTGEIIAENVLFKKSKSLSEEGVFFRGFAKKVRGNVASSNAGFIAEECKGRFKEE